MRTEYETKEDIQTSKKEKKRRGAGFVIVLIILLILFLLSAVILGARLYKLTTRDQYTVDMGLGEANGKLDLFRIEYANELGQITVQGANTDNVVAPGTSVDYDLRLRNNDDVIIDFVMYPEVTYYTEYEVPVEFKVVDSFGNYILGSETEWVRSDEMNELAHRGSIHPGEVYTYHICWRWVFEVDAEHNAYDTYLGNQTGDTTPGVQVQIATEPVANPMPVKTNAHMLHLLGEGLGCCWCCYLVWILLLIVFLLIIRIWVLRRKLNKCRDALDRYEDEMKQDGVG